MIAKGKLKEELRLINEEYEKTIKKVFELYHIKDNYTDKYYQLRLHRRYEAKARELDKRRQEIFKELNVKK